MNLLLNHEDALKLSLRRYSSYFALIIFFCWLSHLSVINFVRNNNYIAQEANQITPEDYLSQDAMENKVRMQLVIGKNQTLTSVLKANGINIADILEISKSLKSKNLVGKVMQGARVIVELATNEQRPDSLQLSALDIFSSDNLSNIKIIRSDLGFVVEEIIVPLTKNLIKIKTEISSNFFNSLRSLNVSANAINEIVNAYSHQIDFQRQLKKGDFIELIIEQYNKSDNSFSHYGDVVLAKLSLANQVHEIYKYQDLEGNSSYYSSEGKIFKRNLLKTPLKLIQISRHFGNRIHPILGYTKMHKGIDFAAPHGTPIYCAGDGIVTEMGRKAGYGNYIKIKHSTNLSTLYAHVANFTQSLKVGSKVKQGFTIAHVGSTGSSTGPHLHYEVHINGRQVNPLSIKTISDDALAVNNLDKFNEHKAYIADIDKFLNIHDSYQISAIP